MGNTLTIASEKQGYTLCDRATYLSMKDKVDLEILSAGDRLLFNQYSVIVTNPSKHPGLTLNTQAAEDFVRFLTSRKGQDMIGSFRKFDTQLFHPNAK